MCIFGHPLASSWQNMEVYPRAIQLRRRSKHGKYFYTTNERHGPVNSAFTVCRSSTCPADVSSYPDQGQHWYSTMHSTTPRGMCTGRNKTHVTNCEIGHPWNLCMSTVLIIQVVACALCKSLPSTPFWLGHPVPGCFSSIAINYWRWEARSARKSPALIGWCCGHV